MLGLPHWVRHALNNHRHPLLGLALPNALCGLAYRARKRLYDVPMALLGFFVNLAYKGHLVLLDQNQFLYGKLRYTLVVDNGKQPDRVHPI